MCLSFQAKILSPWALEQGRHIITRRALSFFCFEKKSISLNLFFGLLLEDRQEELPTLNEKVRATKTKTVTNWRLNSSSSLGLGGLRLILHHAVSCYTFPSSRLSRVLTRRANLFQESLSSGGRERHCIVKNNCMSLGRRVTACKESKSRWIPHWGFLKTRLIGEKTPIRLLDSSPFFFLR